MTVRVYKRSELRNMPLIGVASPKIGLLNISPPWQKNGLREIHIRSRGEWSKKSVQQGRSLFDARSVHAVCEHGKMARTLLATFSNIPPLGLHGQTGMLSGN